MHNYYVLLDDLIPLCHLITFFRDLQTEMNCIWPEKDGSKKILQRGKRMLFFPSMSNVSLPTALFLIAARLMDMEKISFQRYNS